MRHVLVRPVDLRRRMHCAACGGIGRPLLRRYGMPGPDVDWARHEREGRYVLVGCVVSDGDPSHQCRHCGTPVFVVEAAGEDA